MSLRDPLDDLDWGSVVSLVGAHTVTAQAADLDGATGVYYSGDELGGHIEALDFDDIIDRDEFLILRRANIRMSAMSPSTQTADGSYRAMVELADQGGSVFENYTSGSREAMQDNNAADVVLDTFGDDPGADETKDVVGRPLIANGTSPFSDGATGVGGGGAAAEDEIDIQYPPNGPEFDGGDELHLNVIMEHNNISDASLGVEVVYMLWFGVAEMERRRTR